MTAIKKLPNAKSLLIQVAKRIAQTISKHPLNIFKLTIALLFILGNAQPLKADECNGDMGGEPLITDPLYQEMIKKITAFGLDASGAERLVTESPEYASRYYQSILDWHGGLTVIKDAAEFRALPLAFQEKVFYSQYHSNLSALTPEQIDGKLREAKFPFFNPDSPEIVSVYRGVTVDSPELFNAHVQKMQYFSSGYSRVADYWAIFVRGQNPEKYRNSSQVALMIEFKVPASLFRRGPRNDDIAIYMTDGLKDTAPFIHRIGVVGNDGILRWGPIGKITPEPKQ
jgi:hypothetical protein